MKKNIAFIMFLAILVGMGNLFSQTTVSYTLNAIGGVIDGNISFSTQKNDGTSSPASNSSELRLYYASNGNGCSITLHAANGAVITDVKLFASSASYTPTVKYNVDGAADQTATLSSTTYTIAGVSAATSLKIRNANTSNTQLRITSIEVKYTISSADPELSVTPLSDFGTQCVGGVYGPNSFTITGSNLTADDVAVAALNGFSYSTTSGGVYTSSLTLTPIAGSISQEVFVKFAPVIDISYGSNIVIGGGGVAANINQPVTGSGTGVVSAVLSSQAASSVGNTTATLNGNLSTLGMCPNTTEKGFVYSLTSANADPLVAGTGVTKISVAGITTGTYSESLASLTSAASYSFKAYVYDGTDYTYGGVLTFTTKSPASKLAFTANLPISGFINSNLSSFTVEAQRSDNSLDDEFNGNITISKASGSGAISGTLTAAAVNGVATFNAIQFDALGTYTITASSGSLIPVTSGNINITSAPETIAAWNFYGQSGLVDFAATTYHSFLVNPLSPSLITRGADAASSAGSNSFRTVGFKNDGILTTNTDYFQITLSPEAGHVLSLSTIDANFEGTSSFYASPGVTSQFAYSLDGINFTLIGSPVTSTSKIMAQIDLSGVSGLQNISSGTIVTLRYYASGQTTTGGWGFASSSSNPVNDGLKIGGIIELGTSPVISVSEISLDDFAYFYGNGPSAEQSFNLTGINLTGPISITPPAAYEVSTNSGFGFSSTEISIPHTAGSVDQEIYVRLKAGLPLGEYNAQNIQFTSTSAGDKTLELNGDVYNMEPSTQASNIVFSTIGSSFIDLSWTSGNGDHRIVKINTSNSFTNPINGDEYIADPIYGGGEQVVYNNNGSSTSVSGLNPLTQYWFRVYEYNNAGVFTKYNVTTATNNPLNVTTLDGPWEDFEIGSKGSYALGDVSCSAGSWSMSDALLGSSASDRKNGTQSVRVQNSGFIQTNFDITGGLGALTVSHALYGTDVAASWRLVVSNDGGVTWDAFESGAVSSSLTTLETETFNVNVPGDNVRIRLEKLGGTKRINWDDIYITPYSVPVYEWTGTVDTDWNTASNWTPASIPNASSDINIPNVTNKPIIGLGTDALAKNITIENSSSLTVAQGGTFTVAEELINNGVVAVKSNASGDGSLITNTISGSGSYKIDRFLAASKWHLVSSPITNALSGVFADIWLRPYNESTNAFGDYIVPTNIPLNVGQGFSNWTNSDQTRTFSGTVNNASVGPITLPRTNLGWSLIGNPYPSAIDWDAVSGWTKTNVANSIYVWNNNQYATYIGGASTNGGTKNIAMGQGFFVQALAGGGSIAMNNNVRVHNSVDFMKNEEPANIIRVKVATEDYSDEIVIAIRSNVMDEFDYQFDAIKLRGDALAPQLYTQKADKEAVICAYNELDKVNAKFVYLEPGQYQEHVLVYTHTLDASNVPVLFDHVTGTNIYPNVPYTFVPTTENNAERFEFIISSTTGVDNNSNADIMVWESDKVLYVNNLGDEKLQEIKLYDMQGRLVYVGNQPISQLSHLQTAPYIVHVVTNQQIIVRKLVLK